MSVPTGTETRKRGLQVRGVDRVGAKMAEGRSIVAGSRRIIRFVSLSFECASRQVRGCG